MPIQYKAVKVRMRTLRDSNYEIPNLHFKSIECPYFLNFSKSDWTIFFIFSQFDAIGWGNLPLQFGGNPMSRLGDMAGGHQKISGPHAFC